MAEENGPIFWDEREQTYEDFLASLPKDMLDKLLDGKVTIADSVAGLERMIEIARMKPDPDREEKLDAEIQGFSHDELQAEHANSVAAQGTVEAYHDALHHEMRRRMLVDVAGEDFVKMVDDFMKGLFDILEEKPAEGEEWKKEKGE